MLIVGAGGLMLQMIDDLEERYGTDLVYWSENYPSSHRPNDLRSTILSTDTDVIRYWGRGSSDYILCVGGTKARKELNKKFDLLGGSNTGFVSKRAHVSKYADTFECIILAGALVEAGAFIGKGTLCNVNVTVTHECQVGEFVEIGPGVSLAGKVSIGNGSFIGTGAIIIPRVKVGSNVIVAAGAVITKDIPDNVMVAGVPAEIKKHLI